MTVTFYVSWEALAMLSLAANACAGGIFCARQIGDGPRYTPKEDLCGTFSVAFFALTAFFVVRLVLAVTA